MGIHLIQHRYLNSRRLRWVLFGALAVLVALLIGGCAGGGARQTAPLSGSDFADLGKQMVAIEHYTPKELTNCENQFSSGISTSQDKTVKARDSFLLGYVEELRGTRSQEKLDPRNFRDAKDDYTNAVQFGSAYATQASYRLGVLASNGVIGISPEDTLKQSKQDLRLLTTAYTVDVWVRSAAQWESNQPPRMELAGMGGPAALTPVLTANTPENTPVLHSNILADVAIGRLDYLYRTGGGLDSTYWMVIDIIVGFFKHISPAYGLVLSLFFLALVVKLITMPLTTMAYRGMRDMQRIQPLLKELQEKYKDDKAKQAEEQMRIMKEHNVSATGGCLPMLVQLPIFIAVYQAVNVYAFEFSQYGFLWIHKLSRPDLPLLILYALSMIVTQKLTATPSADPQQQVIQRQMTYMMPLMLVIFMETVASAFLLYWFFLNVLSSAHQYYLMQKFKQEETVIEAAPVVAPPAPPSRRKKGKQHE